MEEAMSPIEITAAIQDLSTIDASMREMPEAPVTIEITAQCDLLTQAAVYAL